jgi:hypothetical protein
MKIKSKNTGTKLMERDIPDVTLQKAEIYKKTVTK